MPGFAGLLTTELPEAVSRQCVAEMADSLLHESFYVGGQHDCAKLGVFAGWASFTENIEEAGLFLDRENGVTLILNGHAIVSHGPAFSSGGKALLDLYRRRGEKFIQDLNGLCSGLLVDRPQRRVFLFNDRYGFQRVYFFENDRGLFFASEAKALLRVLPDARAFSERGVAQFLAYGCTRDGCTLFEGVKTLPRASCWSWAEGKLRKAEYFSFDSLEQQDPLLPSDYTEAFRSTFKQVLPRYFPGDESVGVSLTAGLDTRMVMAARPAAPIEQPACYTFCGPRPTILDEKIAAVVAQACGYRHYPIRLEDDFFSDYQEEVDRTVYLTDGGVGPTGAHEVYFNRRARDFSPLRLTGVFGGEVLREVSTFKPLGLQNDLLTRGVADGVSTVVREAGAEKVHPVTFAVTKEIPFHLFGSAQACRSQVTLRTPYLDNELVDLAYRVPRELRRSSAPAVSFIRKEDPSLYRIPTDMAVLGEAKAMQKLWAKFHAKATFKLDYWANDGLPNRLVGLDSILARSANWGILGRHKYLHYRRWFRQQLSDYVNSALGEARQLPFWNDVFISRLAKQHIEGQGNYLQEINAAITLGTVNRVLLKSELHVSARALPLAFAGQ